MSGVNGDSRAVNNNTFETINAAATAIASAENRVPRDAPQKRRWGSCWSMYWCFGFQKHRKRIGHAVLVPEPTDPHTNNTSTSQNQTQAPSVALPFVAPPSSPASFLQSEPPSATQSPAGILSINSVSAGMYSPGGPASIFAIGPYAHETQLVSPPVFSTFTTEPSTAPFTPPPESVHLTTPSSPEVPFAQLLDTNWKFAEGGGQRFPFSQYEFHSYQLHPGSPVGQLISPSSGISGSGTCSPFPDGEFAVGGPQFPAFPVGNPPKLLNLDKLSARDWGYHRGSGTLTPDAVRSTPRGSGTLTPDAARSTPRGSGTLTPDATRSTPRGSGTLTPDDVRSKPRGSGTLTPDAVRSTPRNGFFLLRQLSDVACHRQSESELPNDQIIDHRVSFELTTKVVERSVEDKPTTLTKTVSESQQDEETSEREKSSSEVENVDQCHVGKTRNNGSEKASSDTEESPSHQKHRSITLGSAKEFNFDSTDGNSTEPSIGSDWWANEKVVGNENQTTKNWTFFPMVQPGVS